MTLEPDDSGDRISSAPTTEGVAPVTAAELNRAIGNPDGYCQKCGGACWYRPMCSTSVFACESCNWIAWRRDELAKAAS